MHLVAVAARLPVAEEDLADGRAEVFILGWQLGVRKDRIPFLYPRELVGIGSIGHGKI